MSADYYMSALLLYSNPCSLIQAFTLSRTLLYFTKKIVLDFQHYPPTDEEMVDTFMAVVAAVAKSQVCITWLLLFIKKCSKILYIKKNHLQKKAKKTNPRIIVTILSKVQNFTVSVNMEIFAINDVHLFVFFKNI